MRHEMKVLIGVLGSVAAMAAIGVAGAHAATFTASGHPATVTGEQQERDVFVIQGQKIECQKVHYEAALGEATHSIRVTPSYGGCIAFGFADIAITVNGCGYELTIADSGTSPATTNETHVVCPPGAVITREAPSSSPACIVHVPPQTPTKSGVDYQNVEGGVLVTWTVEGIHSVVTKQNFLCPLSSNSTDTSSKTTGTFLLKGIGGKSFDIG